MYWRKIRKDVRPSFPWCILLRMHGYWALYGCKLNERADTGIRSLSIYYCIKPVLYLRFVCDRNSSRFSDNAVGSQCQCVQLHTWKWKWLALGWKLQVVFRQSCRSASLGAVYTCSRQHSGRSRMKVRGRHRGQGRWSRESRWVKSRGRTLLGDGLAKIKCDVGRGVLFSHSQYRHMILMLWILELSGTTWLVWRSGQGRAKMSLDRRHGRWQD